MSDEPKTPRDDESHLPPQQRDSVVSVPVTPGIRRDTYKDQPQSAGRFQQGYFSERPNGTKGQALHQAAALHQQRSCDDKAETGASQRRSGDEAAVSRRVISATFTVPQVLHYGKDGVWKIEDRCHRSTLLNSFEYLSSDQCPWDHTIVAWTGEIIQVSDSAPSSPRRLSTASQHKSSTGGPGMPHVLVDGETTGDATFLSHDDAKQLEDLLYHDRVRTIPIWLGEDSGATDQGIKLERQSRWRAFAEHDLCALFHYKQHAPNAGRQEDERWDDYYRANKAFADKISEVYQPGDIVMVHDYHLALLPGMLRQRHPDIVASYYLASPFPTSELVRCLHWRKEILEGMLGAGLIGFQARHYAQHFANACARILGYDATVDGVTTPRGNVPIVVIAEGIDVSQVTSLAFTDAVDAKCDELRGLYGHRKLIVGCDPPDSLGGVDKKLQAFARFLETHPHWNDKVVLVQTTSRPAVEDSADEEEESRYANRVNELVNSINHAHGSLGFSPVSVHSHNLSREEYFALLRLGDAALVTSAREGMSTTGLEYVACQRDAHGQLIISEFSGTASSLDEALHVNPWDVAGVAERIHDALTMAPERRAEAHKALYSRVKERDVRFWVDNMLQSLVRASGAHEAHDRPTTSSSERLRYPGCLQGTPS
ncbi:glycosyltransferase family 20 [Purpureocillium lavendulum]|uniref:Glycosyltransferase family 20 n=1 Tax=Purpureocillium lavendulum TaxID=1247861 RepID=A0AB34FCY4_9HYPO|nr:glycosyltransferase family 20 [Purpureocillium lavendulum]